MNEFPKGSPELDRLVNASTNFEDVVQLCRNEMERRGLLPGETPAQPAPAPTEPQDGRMLQRAVTINGRTRLLEAYSVHGLDILQQHFERES
jgi:hypothetical protein